MRMAKLTKFTLALTIDIPNRQVVCVQIVMVVSTKFLS